MSDLRESFFVLQLTGLWQPTHWTPGWKSKLYTLYTVFLIYLIVSFILSLLVNLLFVGSDNVEDFTNNAFLLLTLIVVLAKMINILSMKERIIDMIQDIEKKSTDLDDIEDTIIREKFDRFLKFMTLGYTVLLQGSAIILAIVGFFQIPFGELPHKVWLPYDYSSPIRYYLTYAWQVIAVFIGANVASGFDTFVAGSIMHTSIKITLLRRQLGKSLNQKISKKSELIEKLSFIKWINQHTFIIQLAKKINDIFETTLFLQQSSCSAILCFCIHVMAHMKINSPEILGILTFGSSVLSEIFLFCFAGDEVTTQSKLLSDSVFHSDWWEINHNTRKFLISMMLRSQKSIVFTAGHFFTLSLSSFAKILKMTYSAYSILQ